MNAVPAQILIVDDEKLIRWSTSERLARDHRVLTAETGEQALELLAANNPQVLLLDVKLPGIDGVTVLRRALAMRPELVVVMMSAHGTIETAVEAMAHGAVDFLVKPFALSALEERVKRALATARVRGQLAGTTPTSTSTEALISLVGSSSVMQTLRETTARLATSGTTTVLIEGESGTGKELVGRAIHVDSAREAKPFMKLNCAALPEQLLESELFGHERGAFTDAHTQKRGLMEIAEGGSVMLDEIGDLAPAAQAKLLRLLEQKTYRRVGGTTEMHADVRIMAVTNVDLKKRVHDGHFRADLYFRLNVVQVIVPPLRLRREDIPELVAHFLGHYNRELSQEVRGLSAQALDAMTAYEWPGNVRELRNAIERALILHPNLTELRPEHLPAEMVGPAPASHGAAEA
ncbi:MAG: two component, sigma54 specific, transcriptional regulator, Fis family, partial [Myxococcaceae bacterium]|nr:two component, sigma54 specific, transcriptional regulator, Fis family [Myxococcaceae bacterium]